jgi:hypothetical protein
MKVFDILQEDRAEIETALWLLNKSLGDIKHRIDIIEKDYTSNPTAPNRAIFGQALEQAGDEIIEIINSNFWDNYTNDSGIVSVKQSYQDYDDELLSKLKNL